MYDELIKLINICLVDNELSEKERTVIFNKAKQLGISDEECEVIIDSMIAKATNKSAKSEMLLSHSYTPKTITKISPSELNKTETLENEKQQCSQNLQQLERHQADIQQSLSLLKEEKELLEANNAEKLKNAFCKINDNALIYVEAEIMSKTKSKVQLLDRKLNYDEFASIESKEELSDSYCKLLYEKKWEMPDYRMKLIRTKIIVSLFLKIFIPLLFILLIRAGNYSSLYESQASDIAFNIFFIGVIITVLSFRYLKRIKIKLENPITFNDSNISHAVCNYFYNKIDMELFLELAKAYKSTQKK